VHEILFVPKWMREYSRVFAVSMASVLMAKGTD